MILMQTPETPEDTILFHILLKSKLYTFPHLSLVLSLDKAVVVKAFVLFDGYTTNVNYA